MSSSIGQSVKKTARDVVNTVRDEALRLLKRRSLDSDETRRTPSASPEREEQPFDVRTNVFVHANVKFWQIKGEQQHRCRAR